MAAHESRPRKLTGKLIQPLNAGVGLFPPGMDQGVAPLGFEIKNPVHLDQIYLSIRTFHRKPLYYFSRCHSVSSVLSPLFSECFIA